MMKRAATILVVDFALVLAIFTCVDCNTTKEKLKCYQCAVEDTSLCTDEYLLPCPDNQAYDSCMTRTSKTKSDGFLIQKTCALAPCTFRDPTVSSGLGLDDCDRSKDEYDCISCCKESGCNRAGPATYRPIAALLLVGCMLGLLALVSERTLVVV